MSRVLPLVTVHNVCLFPNEEFGLEGVSFKIFTGKRYHLLSSDEDRQNGVLGLLEQRYSAHSGITRFKDHLTIQSDRLLMGDRLIDRRVEQYLGLTSDLFYLNGKRCSKLFYINQLKAKSILHLPVYKLRGKDKILFVLLAALFQKSGLVLFSRFEKLNSDPDYSEFIKTLFQREEITIVLAEIGLDKRAPENIQALTNEFEQIRIAN